MLFNIKKWYNDRENYLLNNSEGTLLYNLYRTYF